MRSMAIGASRFCNFCPRGLLLTGDYLQVQENAGQVHWRWLSQYVRRRRQEQAGSWHLYRGRRKGVCDVEHVGNQYIAGA